MTSRTAISRLRGAPPGVRLMMAPYSAVPHIDALCNILRAPAEFRAHLLTLGYNESRLTLGRPADRFDIRPGVNVRVSAWGVFQWNDPALRRLDREIPSLPEHAYQLTVAQEVYTLGAFYYGIYRYAIQQGMPPALAGALMRLWHAGPGYADLFIAAWRRVGINAKRVPLSAVIHSLRNNDPNFTRVITADDMISRHMVQLRALRRAGVHV